MRSDISRRIRHALGRVLLPALILAGPVHAQGVRTTPPADLRDVFGTGYMLQDRNGDGHADFVHARVVVPAAASAAEAATAANIVARLSYESMATNLGLVVREPDLAAAFDTPAILVGRTSAQGRLPAGAAAGGLAPGEGAISFVPPGTAFRQGALLIEGGDATGLLAAGDYFGGRYPSVWALRGGSTYTQLLERLSRYLAQHGAAADSLALERIVVQSSRPGISRVQIRARFTDADARVRAAAALTGDSIAAPRDTTVRNSVRRSELDIQDLHRIDVVLTGAGADRTIRLLPARPWPARNAQELPAAAAPDFTLSDFYTIRGIYRDTRQDLVPDRTDAYLSVSDGAGATGVGRLAARIAVETAGMRFPLVRVAGEDDYPQRHGMPILFGSDHYQTRRLQAEGALHGAIDRPGEGFIQFAPRAFNGRHGVVIGGTDERGLQAIAEYVAGRMPYLWDHGKGEYRLSDAETEVRRFFQARETPGQVALALEKLDGWIARLDGRAISSVNVELATQAAPAQLHRHIEQRLRAAFPNAAVAAVTHATGFGVGKPIFEEEVTLPWEVDEARAALRDALPGLAAGSRGRIEVRVSESPAVRAALASEIRDMLAARGIAAGAYDVVVLSAYKQGYSWLNDVVLPQLRSRTDIGRIDIAYHTLRDSREVRWQQVESETRWLQELFPIDAIFARDLGIADSLIVFAPTQRREPVYTVHVTDTAGTTILNDSFDTKYVIRPYFDLFPEYEQIRVTTGWLTVESDGRTVADRRIRTDPEAFWDHLQDAVFGRIIDYVMDIQDGRPSPGNAPYFDELRIDLTMSEPDYRIGIDEELISSLESLHEDIYFQTLMLFDLIGQRWGVPALAYPGRVLPYIQPAADGQPGRARIRFTGKERGVPELALTYTEDGGEPFRQRYPLNTLGVDAPKLRGITVRAGETGLRQMLFEVVATDSVVDYDAYRDRGTEAVIDRTFLPASLLTGMVTQLGRLHGDGILTDALAFDRVGELAFRFILSDSAATFSRLAAIERTRAPRSTRNPVLYAEGWRHGGEPLVQWQTPIPPPENDSILARLATFPGVDVYYMTQSFLGRNIFAADFLPPFEATHVSQARLNALRPTLFLSGRQHANEVSSTSHLLRLGEMLATDSTHREMLKKVNVVLHPIANPDGAQLAYDMQLLTPDHMLHAGYLGALGVDMIAGAGSSDPIYPESQVRPEIQQTWLPDIFINLHGYPSHEWVQLFSGYSAWVRGRTGTQRSWWAPRGWFIPGFSYVDDPRYPELKIAQFAILDTIAAAITGLPDVEAMNQRQYARYAKYGRQDVDNFREHFHNGMLVYLSMRGRDASGTGINSPRVTYFSATTEAPDETARGEWLELVASAGLAHTTALLRYLHQGQNRVERDSAEYDGVVMRSVFRLKPVLPAPESQR
jgi:hypothetical protein